MSGGILDHRFDAIVVGAGMGGGVLGRTLTERGLSVLFLEKGRSGWRREETGLDLTSEDPVARLMFGAWPDPIEIDDGGGPRSMYAPLGCGVGGSSVFFAATLERPERHDLDDGWPVSYEEMGPWYDQAERILHVRGEPDPLSDVPCPNLQAAPPSTAADAAIMGQLRRNGQHPYRLHVALRYVPGCAECLGRKCPRTCKMDGRSAGVEPALATGRAALLEECEVLRLVGGPTRISAVEVLHGGEVRRLTAPRIILAAGALSTPRLLIASASEAWPQGCGNGGDLVGRNLMVHLNEMFAVWPRRGDATGAEGPSRAVALRDLMIRDGHRLGMVQSLGVDAREPEILHAFRQRMSRHALGRTRLAREWARVPAKAASRVLGTAKLFVGLLEDHPDPANRIVVDPGRPGQIICRYHIPEELQARRRLFRRGIRQAFRNLHPLFLNHAAEPNWGHSCGTARMGRDPATSVVDPTCRVHGLENLWIADTSVFPTSMGVNPSLTLAANALRVGSIIAGKAS
ncbi:GMC oxidoreductase [Rubellimicrobium arenae]|uniref:GMC oxidoreductase n=1 Tax=Rubellimicrobium arenae TaxID=2817372 RepID=UPI001B3185AF|nr:GMC family oxidoreductase [Rubellimicrobium arenae]